MADDALAAAAAELSGVPLSRFTAERSARAKAARAAGDRDLAARIAALPKPSVAAWLVDALVTGAPDDLQRVLDLGGELREAQRDADRDRLRELSARRRTLLPEVAEAARSRAEEAGQRVGAGALEEFQQTLQAALASPAAAAAIGTGRLARALAADGVEPVDLDDALLGGGAEDVTAPTRSRGGQRKADDERERREAEERARRLEEARAAARTAAARARDAAAAAEDREAEAADLARRLTALQERLDTAQEALESARAAADDARRTAEDAAHEADRLAG